MLSKQVMAFLAGVVIVVAGTAAFVVYDQQKGGEYSADADTPSGDKKFSDDPTSGFVSYDGQRYFLKFGHVSSSSNTYATYFTLEFDSDRPVIVKAFVDNIQMSNGTLYQKGHTLNELHFSSCDINNCGLELMKELQFSFLKLNERTDITYSTTLESYTLTINLSGNVPSSGVVYLYSYSECVGSFNLNGSNSYTLTNFYFSSPSAIVIGSDIIYPAS